MTFRVGNSALLAQLLSQVGPLLLGQMPVGRGNFKRLIFAILGISGTLRFQSRSQFRSPLLWRRQLGGRCIATGWRLSPYAYCR